MSADVMKIPEPIIEPATIVVASTRPSLLGSVLGNAGCVEPDFVIVPMVSPQDADGEISIRIA